MEIFLDPQNWIALLTLTALEIVLGIDNIIFIAILVSRLPPERQKSARILGLGLAMITRILLLLSLAWIMGLSEPLFSVFGHTVSGRDLVLLLGGLFLIGKSTSEIHHDLEDGDEESAAPAKTPSYFGVLAQIAIIDIVFSLDSVVTAVGLAEHVPIMVIAIVISVLIMMVAAGPISEFVERHPTMKMLALSFLILIGTALVGEGMGFHIPKGYLYFAMAFSVGVEFLNLKLRAKTAGA